MPAEATQEKGRSAVALVKRWLEATTHLELPWNVYENSPMCELELLSGVKRMDLVGYFLGASRQPVVVENKDYSSDGGQYPMFQEFLAVAYSSTARIVGNPGTSDNLREFIYVTTHPFGPLTHWNSLASYDEIMLALAAHPEVLSKGHVIDEDLVRTVAGRVWVLVVSTKQEQLSLTPTELAKVHKTLKRKDPTL